MSHACHLWERPLPVEKDGIVSIDYIWWTLIYKTGLYSTFRIPQAWVRMWEVCCFLLHCFKRIVSVLPSQPKRSLVRIVHTYRWKTFKFVNISIATGTAWKTQHALEWIMRYKRNYVGLSSRPVMASVITRDISSFCTGLKNIYGDFFRTNNWWASR